MKKIKADVEKSLYYAANGRLRPAEDKALAKEQFDKMFICPVCMLEIEGKKIQFGEHRVCPKCGEEMLEQLM